MRRRRKRGGGEIGFNDIRQQGRQNDKHMHLLFVFRFRLSAERLPERLVVSSRGIRKLLIIIADAIMDHPAGHDPNRTDVDFGRRVAVGGSEIGILSVCQCHRSGEEDRCRKNGCGESEEGRERNVVSSLHIET